MIYIFSLMLSLALIALKPANTIEKTFHNNRRYVYLVAQQITDFRDLAHFFMLDKRHVELGRSRKFWRTLVNDRLFDVTNEKLSLRELKEIVRFQKKMTPKILESAEKNLTELSQNISVEHRRDIVNKGCPTYPNRITLIVSKLIDSQILQILQNIQPAMESEVEKYLISDFRLKIWFAKMQICSLSLRFENNHRLLCDLFKLDKCTNLTMYLYHQLKNIKHISEAGFIYALTMFPNQEQKFWIDVPSNDNNSQIKFRADSFPLYQITQELIPYFTKAIESNIPTAKEELETLKNRGLGKFFKN